MTKAEQARLTAWRLKILRWAQEEPRQVARTCRHFGISRTAFYRWKRRFDAHGEAGLGDRPRTPQRSPRATSREVVSPTTGKRLYQFTAIDDCTRIRVLKVYDACNQRTAIQFLNELCQRLPFRIHVLQTDNGAGSSHSFTGTPRRSTSATSTSAHGRRG